MKVLVTGARGFIGRNLVVMLRRQSDVEILRYNQDDDASVLGAGLATADVIFHLAGVNRPDNLEDFVTGNTDFTEKICESLLLLKRTPVIIYSSSIQAVMDNPYGKSKLNAEKALIEFAGKTGAHTVIFRMPNVFGKWCRPNYNSGVATFCHNIARNLPITISNRANEVNLVYIDDVCCAMMEAAGILPSPHKYLASAIDPPYAGILPSFKMTLGEIVDIIHTFKELRASLQVPKFDNPFVGRLYAAYLSYLEESDFSYSLDIKSDDRGCLAEFLKSSSFGQIFVSRTKPGITRGNHYHHTKTEKFLVVQGEAMIRFRKIGEDAGNQKLEGVYQESNNKKARKEVIEYRVSGEEFRVVDIPPGYTHSIENIGDKELVTIFWASSIFDPEQADTYFEEVYK